ncbi:hypothetical protein FNF27_04088 [Cafeteria roenbergensis]|uniref:Uncharacterized protein n=1 Tax=Cafeteria roenbergensis TaxID=33653 RepID=A0A5A8EA68_CAFRO|nr:hypothetical protein FNF27_04088 [Cafeteria roenbergensis]
MMSAFELFAEQVTEALRRTEESLRRTEEARAADRREFLAKFDDLAVWSALPVPPVQLCDLAVHFVDTAYVLAALASGSVLATEPGARPWSLWARIPGCASAKDPRRGILVRRALAAELATGTTLLERVPLSSGHDPVVVDSASKQDAAEFDVLFAPPWVSGLVSARNDAAHPFGPFAGERRPDRRHDRRHDVVSLLDLAEHGDSILKVFNATCGVFVKTVGTSPARQTRATYADAVGPPPGAAAAAAAGEAAPVKGTAMSIVSERAEMLRLLGGAIEALSRIARARSHAPARPA